MAGSEDRVGTDYRLSSGARGDGRVVVVHLQGALDLLSAQDMLAFVDDAAPPGVEHLVVDLSAVTFLSSRGLSALVRAATGRSRTTAAVHLTGVTGNRSVSRVIEVAGLTDVFHIVAGPGDVG